MLSTTLGGRSGRNSISQLPDDPRLANGLPGDTDNEMRNAFVKYCITIYRRKEWEGSTLSEYLADHFVTFITAHIASINNNNRCISHDLLPESKIYVKKGRRK